MTLNMGGGVLFDEPMSRHTYIRLGGPADAFVRPSSLDDLTKLIKWACQKKIPYLVVGGGSNLVVKDNGIRGLVISLTRCLNEIKIGREKRGKITVSAMAGVKTRTFCSLAMEKGLKGMNFAVGIPGTVGGGIAMNAGTRAGAMDRVIGSVKILLPDGRILDLNRTQLRFGYRELVWNGHSIRDMADAPVILEGDFILSAGDPEALKTEAKKMLEDRLNHQPVSQPSAGCFFKNPESGEPAGKLIDRAGLKNARVGGAMVSPRHANFIVNTGRASTSDVLELMRMIQEKVAARFDVNLIPEVKIVGT